MLSGMKETTAWRLICAPGGWVRATRTPDATTVYMRLRGAGGGQQQRLNVHTVVMDSDSPISTHVWRYVPFQAVEEVANGLQGFLAATGKNPFRDVLLAPAKVEPVDVEQLERHFGTEEELAAADGPDPVVVGNMVLVSDSGAVSTQPGDEPAPLTKPSGGRITDEFLAELAQMYRWLVATGRTAPSTMIAEQTDTPVATVRRWVSSARKKGMLPPGRPGRAG